MDRPPGVSVPIIHPILPLSLAPSPCPQVIIATVHPTLKAPRYCPYPFGTQVSKAPVPT